MVKSVESSKFGRSLLLKYSPVVLLTGKLGGGIDAIGKSFFTLGLHGREYDDSSAALESVSESTTIRWADTEYSVGALREELSLYIENWDVPTLVKLLREYAATDFSKAGGASARSTAVLSLCNELVGNQPPLKKTKVCVAAPMTLALYISKTNTELICLLQMQPDDAAVVAPSHYFDVVEVCPLNYAFLYSPPNCIVSVANAIVSMAPTDRHSGHS